MPLKAILMLLGTAVLLYVGYYFTLYAIHGFSPDFLQINQCVESGGRWNPKTRSCEKFYESTPLEVPANPVSSEQQR